MTASDGKQSQVERSAKVTGSVVILLALEDVMDKFVSCFLGRNSAFEADCSYKLIAKPYVLFTVSMFSTTIVMTLQIFRCSFGYREREKHYEAAWEEFMRQLDASVKRVNANSTLRAPYYMHPLCRDDYAVRQNPDGTKNL